MTSFDERLYSLNRKRRKIIMEFHTMKAQNPQAKRFSLIREVARKLEYVIDDNSSNSYVMKVIREWNLHDSK